MKVLLAMVLLGLSLNLNAAEEVEVKDADLKSAEELTLELDLEELNMEEEMSGMEINEGAMQTMRPPRRGVRPPRRGVRPPRRMPPRHRPRPRPPRHEIMCVAKDSYGYRYKAWGYRPYRVERIALNDCERYSYDPYSCYVRGCTRYRSIKNPIWRWD